MKRGEVEGGSLGRFFLLGVQEELPEGHPDLGGGLVACVGKGYLGSHTPRHSKAKAHSLTEFQVIKTRARKKISKFHSCIIPHYKRVRATFISSQALI